MSDKEIDNSLDMDDLEKKGKLINELLVETPIKGRLPESMFVAEFLPYFSGELKIDKDSSVIPYWIGVAGSPTAEVDIIDKAGNTIYTVPALFSTDTINVTETNSRPISDIMLEYEQRSSRFPIDGENFLEASLKIESNESDKFKSAEGRWETILKRYDKEVPSNDNTTVSNKGDSLNDDDLEYD